MQLQINDQSNITVKLESVTLVYRPFVPRDAFVAAAIVSEFNYAAGKLPEMDLKQLTDHAIDALQSIEGEFKYKDEQITAQMVKELYREGKIKFLFMMQTFITPWAVEVLQGGGFLDKLTQTKEK